MPDKKKLFVALPSYGSMPAQFAQCLLKLIADQPCSLVVKFIVGDSLVSRARNTLTAEFLQSDCTHLLFLDTDLIFDSDQIIRLVEHDEDIVGGFYPKKADGKLEWVCNAHLDFPPPDARGLQSLRYLGTGFMLVARAVFNVMISAGVAPRYIADGSGREEHDFWTVGVHEGVDGSRRYLSEDWYFCQRCLDLGYKVFGDTKVVARHIGTAVYPLKSQQDDLLVERPCVLPHCPESHKSHVATVFEGEYWIRLDPPPRTVLDIGACVGAFTAWAHLQWPDAEIAAYEPHPGNAELFLRNIPLLGSSGVVFNEAAIRDFYGTADLAEGPNNCGEASFHRETSKPITVICYAAHGLASAEFVKIDTEGCEIEIVKAIDLSETRAIALEYHSATDRDVLRDLLISYGFEEYGIPPLQSVGVLKFIKRPE